VTSERKILLISANAFTTPYPVYPLGISYLITYLEKRLPDYCFSFFDFNTQSINDLTEKLKSNKFDIVGISLRNIDDINIFEKNSFIGWYKTIFQIVRENTNAIIVAGGPGFSIFPELLFETLQPDFGIKGEGEEALFQLIKSIGGNLDHENIEGLVYRTSSGKVTVNPKTSFLKSLELSFDRELVDFYWNKSGMLNIQTKRGCPYNCIYCSYPVIEGRNVRTLDADFIVDTLKDLYFNLGVNYVFFTDSVFNISNSYNIELAKKIIESGVKVEWGAYFSPHNLTRELLTLFKKAGLTHIEFGTESFSDQQLMNYRKHFRFNEVLEISNISSDLGIFFAHFLILGGYGETEQSLDDTFENSKKMPRSVNFPYIGMRIYPNTELFNIAMAEGKISGVKDLLDPVYYISDSINIDTIKERALATEKKWIFADFENEDLINKFRSHKRRGPLWEFLRF
jgi:radical SAM superfamily enzyme YgiQ (UPF0313 family)